MDEPPTRMSVAATLTATQLRERVDAGHALAMATAALMHGGLMDHSVRKVRDALNAYFQVCAKQRRADGGDAA